MIIILVLWAFCWISLYHCSNCIYLACPCLNFLFIDSLIWLHIAYPFHFIVISNNLWRFPISVFFSSYSLVSFYFLYSVKYLSHLFGNCYLTKLYHHLGPSTIINSSLTHHLLALSTPVSSFVVNPSGVHPSFWRIIIMYHWLILSWYLDSPSNHRFVSLMHWLNGVFHKRSIDILWK